MAERQVTNLLMDEHRGIERMLNIVEGAANRVGRGEPVPPRLFVDAATFFRNFADRCHHAKEEKLLFLRMALRGLPDTSGPLPVMLSEHEQGRSLVRQMRELGEQYAAGTLADPQPLATAVRSYVHLLRQHIQKEDRILYPIADQLLTPQDQAELVEACDRVEREEMGEGEHERFHAMIDELEGVMAG